VLARHFVSSAGVYSFMCRWLILAGVLAAGVVAGQEPANQDGLLQNPRLRAHAHLPEHNPPGRPLREALGGAKAPRNLEFVHSGPHPTVSASGIGASFLELLYAEDVCNADAVLVGKPVRAAFHLSVSGTSVYGDHVLLVTAVLKNNPRGSIGPGAEIVVTRPGGSIRFPEGTVETRQDTYPPLEQQKTYLLLLRFLEESATYAALDGYSTLMLNQLGAWTILTRGYSNLRSPELASGTYEAKVAGWLRACRWELQPHHKHKACLKNVRKLCRICHQRICKVPIPVPVVPPFARMLKRGWRLDHPHAGMFEPA
jgi:hypothetical protein